MIKLADAAPADAGAIAGLLAELAVFYGGTPEGTPDERAEQVRAALFGDPPAARALLAWDGAALAGLASWTFLWPAADHGCSRVEWTTDTGNSGARRFYESLGAAPLATKIFYRLTPSV